MNFFRLLLLLVLLPCLAACGQAQDEGTPRSARTPPSGAEIAVARLPAEGRATLALIKQGGPFPYGKDGTVFGNREKLLPNQPRGYYREYTVPTPGLSHRGARRIVAGGRGAEYWYTADHYRSFKRIKE